MLKKLILAVAVLTASLTLTINAAEAARIGGGRSIGTQRSIAPRQATPPAAAPQQAARPATAPNTPAAPAQSGWRKWAGPLAGIAAAVGLAAMLSHFGIGGDFAGIILLVIGGLVAFMLIRKLLAGNRPAEPAMAGVPNAYAREAAPQAAFGGAAPQNEAASRFPAGFDVETFTRQAKLNFIRLQAANDACNLADIREFTSPEIFAEIKLGIDERGGKQQRTDVVMLEAEVVEVVEENAQYIASVHYSGKLREEEGAAPQDFNELWHLTKPTDGNRGWVLAGIQQYN
ncbi:Tim44-like domain-containing protein [Uliginosibacterium sp. 31-16]|uniref:Tim44 domain-containing protein n=1 Tax=Uliginosibacterium sp. 31-16 TaxID=3068315 RepID=UPI00273F80B7|nr:Tim44-like domain-containing protein [Uliginosibacterium sp. 31-16]MDP5238796.1 Tim44-like domain-containing protein [Uliginosibacterium sp. 31-16]